MLWFSMAGRGGDVSIEVGIEATKGMYLSKPLPYPSWSDQASGGMSIMDLPLQDLPRDQAMLKHFVDVIADVPPPDKTAIETAINAGTWGRDKIPVPFCLKADMELKLITQFVVLDQSNGKVTIMKHMYSPDMKLGKEQVHQLCHGTPYSLKWQGHAMNFRKGFQWFLEQLGGWQCRQYALSHVMTCQKDRGEGSKGFHLSELTEEEVDKGFAFIQEEAGNLASEWKRVQWITKNLHINSDSPIFQWPIAIVEKSLNAIRTDGVLALPVEDFYLTLADVDIDVLKFAVNPMLKAMTTHAIGLVGGPGSGKTPLARVLALCASRCLA